MTKRQCGGALAVLVVLALVIVGGCIQPGPPPATEQVRIVSWQFTGGQTVGTTRRISGTARNTTNRILRSVGLKFDLYNASNVRVGSLLVSTYDLKPGVLWRFDELVLEEQAASAKFLEAIIL